MEDKINTEKRLATMEQKIDNLIEDVKEIASDIKDHVKWEAEKYEKLDGKYSGKWVEKAVIIMSTSVALAIIAAVLKLIFKP